MSPSHFPILLLLLLVLAVVLSSCDPGARRGGGRGRGRTPAAGAAGADGRTGGGEQVGRSRGGNLTSAAEGQQRKEKVFSLFSVVNFQNTGCQSTVTLTGGQSNYRNGTCYSSTECSDKSGQASGTCAAGFGVCCVFILDNGGTVNENCTYIQNPSFPTGDTNENTVSYTVEKCSNAVCFLRLDFESFTTQGPAVTTEIAGGTCPDTFTISTSTGQSIPPFCGENAGQHMYIDIGANSGDSATIQFAFNTPAGTTALARLWDVKVSQIECSNGNAPPGTCLQYYTDLTGRIETFNFNSGSGQHLLSQRYSVCVRPLEGYCCVNYQICPDQLTLGTAIAVPGFSLDGTTNMAMTDNACVLETQDYIAIPQSAQECNLDSSSDVFSRYCGAFLNPVQVEVNVPICDCTAPFTVDIRTDATSDNGGAANAQRSYGVCLEYNQVPCN